MKQIIKETIKDLVSDFLYYDRKEDFELPNGVIETEIDEGNLTINEIVTEFKLNLEKEL